MVDRRHRVGSLSEGAARDVPLDVPLFVNVVVPLAWVSCLGREVDEHESDATRGQKAANAQQILHQTVPHGYRLVSPSSTWLTCGMQSSNHGYVVGWDPHLKICEEGNVMFLTANKGSEISADFQRW